MKKKIVVSVIALMTAGLFTGCTRADVEKLAAPVMDVMASDDDMDDDTEKTSMDEDEESQEIPEINTEYSIDPGLRIAVVSKSVKGQFWENVEKGMHQAIADVNEAYGYKKDDQITMTFEGPADEEDVTSQVNILDAVIAENPDVICISASDMQSCQAQLEAAKENGIPVVVFDSSVSDTKLVRYIRVTDNYRVGEVGAYRLAQAIGKMGKVAVFSAQEKTESIQARVQGFQDFMEAYVDIDVVDVIYADQVDDMEAAMKEVLEKYPTLDGVFCTNAVVAEQYLKMDKDETRDSVAMVGVDATSLQQDAIREGTEVGVVSQKPYVMGYQTAWAAMVATTPHKERLEMRLEKKVGIAPAWIDASNLDDPEYADYIYEK